MPGSSRKILVVDGDATVLRMLDGPLRDYSLAEAGSGEQALAMLSSFVPDVVVLDLTLPGIDGCETCRLIRARPFGQAIQVLAVSAESSRAEQHRAYAAGADDYLAKPFNPHELRSRVRLHFRLCGALETAAATGSDGLRRGAAGEADEGRAPFAARVRDATVAALTKLAELRDAETRGHLVRMRSYSQIVAEELACHGPYRERIDEQFLDDLHRASPLHDVGKVWISETILRKPAGLTPAEFEAMKRHTTIGADLLERAAAGAPDAPFLRMAATIARSHHERFDGRGYPDGLRGTGIPLPARIVTIADAYDAITSVRPYKAAQSAAAARKIIERDSGSHFDPVVVEAFLRRFDALASLQKRGLERGPATASSPTTRIHFARRTKQGPAQK
jgi:putative two-component system response regulator